MIIKLPNNEFRAESGVIEICLLHKPDDDWEFSDKARHLHRWQNGKLPSLKEIIDCPADDEYPTYSHMICKRCGETIKPGYITGEIEFLPGLVHYYINDIEVTREEFEKEYSNSIQLFS